MASAECKLIMGVWGTAPVRGSGEQPPEAESFLKIEHPKEGINCLMFMF